MNELEEMKILVESINAVDEGVEHFGERLERTMMTAFNELYKATNDEWEVLDAMEQWINQHRD